MSIRSTIPKEASLDIFDVYKKMSDAEACTATTVVNQIMVTQKLRGEDFSFLDVEALRKKEQELRGYLEFDPHKSANYPETYKAAMALKWIDSFDKIYQSKRDYLYWLSRGCTVATSVWSAHAVLFIAFKNGYFYFVDPSRGKVKRTRNFDDFGVSYIARKA